jgi:UDP-glucuronate decarboxylase
MQALNNEDITIYGEGQQTRSFCFVDDLIDAMVAMMNQDRHVGPINTGNPNEFTILQLAETVIRLTGSKSTIVKLPLPADDPKQRKPDITKAREILKWEPKIQLEEGLKKTIDFFKGIDLRRYKKPTNHTALANTEKMQISKKDAEKNGEDEEGDVEAEQIAPASSKKRKPADGKDDESGAELASSKKKKMRG